MLGEELVSNTNNGGGLFSCKIEVVLFLII